MVPHTYQINEPLTHSSLQKYSTQMSDELLCDLHPLEQLLQEAIRKPLLYGRDVRLHVLQTPGGMRAAGQSNPPSYGYTGHILGI